MIQKIPLGNILFLDVETVPMCQDFSQLPPAFQSLWEKKAERLKANEMDTAEKLFNERAGIYAEFGKVVCVSAGFFRLEDSQTTFRVKAFYGHDEKELLEAFSELLNAHFNTAAHYLCGHNGKEFDFPYLSRRMLVHGIPLPFLLNNHGKKPWETSLLDTMELWKFGDYKSFTSLALLAALFDIPTPKDDIDGSDVSRVYYEEDDLERIAVYCSKDVVTTARVYLKYLNLGELAEENVHYI
jgi:3'-5' exonuclease